MRNALAALILVTLPLLSSCATRQDIALMRAEARIAELEKYIQGAQDDNAALQMYGIELQLELRRWQQGAEYQAQELARIRDTCEL